MPKQSIPKRMPISDAFSGMISQFDNTYILSTERVPEAPFIAEGDFIIRYGITYLGKPQYSIVPDLVVVDYGDMLVGEDAWAFLINQSNLYPRSDVLGYRNDGVDEMLVIKQLDLAVPFDVLVFNNEDDHEPIANVSALIAPKTDTYSERLLKHLNRFDSLDDWQATNE